jgi:putative glycosyltransferase (TIGR04348 family)
MRFLIVTPAKRGSTKGNRITAERWARILRLLGHQVTVSGAYTGGAYDGLIALHARRSAKSVADFQTSAPGRPVIVALTGTDLHHDLGRNPIVASTLRRADRIVVLEPVGQRKLDPLDQAKTHVIFQSSFPLSKPPARLKRFFEISVLGHLRTIKDPFRAAQAARLLPEDSRIRIVHLGEALSVDMERRARRETESNDRYRWLGPVSHGEAIRRLARSRVTVLSSRAEGGSSVISEAIMNNVPILASRNDAAIGMLEPDYPGLFEFGATRELASLMMRSEQEAPFYKQLIAAGSRLKPRFSLAAEVNAWNTLIASLGR